MDDETHNGDNVLMFCEERLEKLAEKIVCEKPFCESKCKVELKKVACEVSVIVKRMNCERISYEDEPKTVEFHA